MSQTTRTRVSLGQVALLISVVSGVGVAWDRDAGAALQITTVPSTQGAHTRKHARHTSKKKAVKHSITRSNPGAPSMKTAARSNFNFPVVISRPPVTDLVIPRSFAPLAHDINHMASVSGLIDYPVVSHGLNADGTPMWDGQGALPNAFQAPWHLPEAKLDPGFYASYYSSNSGLIDSADAPWHIGLGAELGTAVFNRGLAYVGKYGTDALQPEWDPTAQQQQVSSSAKL